MNASLKSIFHGMHSRCGDLTNKHYGNYGGRGVRVCAEWSGERGRANFERDILAGIGPRPSPLHTLDRIENEKGYEPGNIRWATRREQQQNTRANRRVTFNGETLVVAEWARRIGVSEKTLAYRLGAGWPLAVALSSEKRQARPFLLTSKLDESDVALIKAFLLAGDRTNAVARRFGVKSPTISDIRLGRTWKHVRPIGSCHWAGAGARVLTTRRLGEELRRAGVSGERR